MTRPITINQSLDNFNKIISVSADKSLSIRWALMASIASGSSKAYNLLRSEDVLSTLNCLKKLGVKIELENNYCKIYGKGINGIEYKNNLTLNAGNSGTLGRLILALLIDAKSKIKLVGDKSLSSRDFSRVIEPLKKFGVNFYPKNVKKLPLKISGSNIIKPIRYYENKGSAQCKSCIMLAALKAEGKTLIKAKKSRDHTEILFKHLKIPIKVSKKKHYDLIEIQGIKKIAAFNYRLPSDISSSAFFLVLTILSKNSKLKIKNVNINPSRTGVIKILNKMGAKILLKNKKIYKGEKIADIEVTSVKSLKAINCPTKLNSSAIDEFLIIFLVAAKAKGVSYFKNLSELNKKESPRLKIASKILNMIGVKTKVTESSIKIFGQPNISLKKNYEVKDYLKDHRVFMMTTIIALTLGGKWKIYNPESIKTSFPSFLKIVKEIGGKIN